MSIAAEAASGRRVLRHRDAERSCGTKHAHPSYGKAAAHIRSIAQRFGPDAAAGLVVYRCRYAGHYHVGHGRGAAMLPGEAIPSGADVTCGVCGETYGLRPMQSGAGWYIGTECCGMRHTRESRYWDTKEETEIALVAWTRGVCVGRRGA